MLSVGELRIFMERLEKKNLMLSLEIELITAWITEHRKIRPPHVDAPSSLLDARNKYHSWRKVSSRLHQRRSELKTKQEKNRAHLFAVIRRIEEMETGLLDFPVFTDNPLETDLTSVDACA